MDEHTARSAATLIKLGFVAGFSDLDAEPYPIPEDEKARDDAIAGWWLSLLGASDHGEINLRKDHAEYIRENLLGGDR